jgi:hypothetical protein
MVANLSGGTLAFCAAISWLVVLLSALMHDFSWTSAAVSVPLTAIAAAEFVGASRLKRLDLRGPRHLALNQLCLILLVCAYCGWQMYWAWVQNVQIPPQLQHTGDPGVDQTMADLAKMAQPLVIGTYGLIALLTTLFCAGHAWYYASRRHWIEAALALRPPSAAAPGPR